MRKIWSDGGSFLQGVLGRRDSSDEEARKKSSGLFRTRAADWLASLTCPGPWRGGGWEWQGGRMPPGHAAPPSRDPHGPLCELQLCSPDL